MYGRILKLWEPLALTELDKNTPQGVGKWTSRAIRLCWKFELYLWMVQNQLAHGIIGGLSTQERQ